MKVYPVAILSLLLSSTAYCGTWKETSMEEVKNMTLGTVCGKKLYIYIPYKSVVGEASWGKDVKDTAEKADQLITDTEQACLAKEKEIKDVLNELGRKWTAKCISEKCRPSVTISPRSYCGSGEVTVYNRHNKGFFCTYPVSKGKAHPKPFAQRSFEKCFVGRKLYERSPGYSGAKVTIPPADSKPKVSANYICHPPGQIDISTYALYEMPKKPNGAGDKEDPQKDDSKDESKNESENPEDDKEFNENKSNFTDI